VKSKLTVWPILCVATALTLQAQNKVAVINVQAAIIGTKDGQKAAAELQAKAAPKQKDIEGKQNEINGLQDQLAKGQNTLSEATKNELYKNIEAKKKNLQRDVEDASAEMDQEQQKILQQLGQKILAVIERYSRDQGFTLVLDVSSPQSPIMYASPTIEITKEIVDLYDKTSTMSNPAPSKPSATPTNPPAAKPPATTTPGTPAGKPATPPPPPKKQ